MYRPTQWLFAYKIVWKGVQAQAAADGIMHLLYHFDCYEYAVLSSEYGFYSDKNEWPN